MCSKKEAGTKAQAELLRGSIHYSTHVKQNWGNGSPLFCGEAAEDGKSIFIGPDNAIA